jgi:hypothetical protein
MNDTFISNVNKLYRNKTYLENYGGSVLITVIVIITFLLVFSYFNIKSNINELKQDWNKIRCSPGIIPFAGIINKDPNDTVFESTSKNFSICTSLILQSIVDVFTKPILGTINSLTLSLQKMAGSGGALQKLIANVFERIRLLMEYFTNRIASVIIPIQKMFINMKDVLHKMNGVIVTLLHTVVAKLSALRALIGSFMDIVIAVMIAASSAIVAMWILPFTWPIAITSTIFYIAIMTLMIIIKVNMSQTLLISSGNIPPKPGKPSNCFHKDTKINTISGSVKISELIPGDVLLNNDMVTSVFKTRATENTLYNLNGVVVTENHHVYNPSLGWIRVENDPRSVRLNEKEDVVYCINTNSKKIEINDTIFMDWDEVTISEILTLKNKKYIYTKKDINTYLNSGVFENTLIEMKNGEKKQIQDIDVGEILKNNIVVTGIVQSLDNKNTFNYFNDTINLKGNNLIFEKSNLAKYHKTHTKHRDCNNKLYHILTDKGMFYIDDVKIYDFNACLEYFLND